MFNLGEVKGLVRIINSEGRISIPKEFRKELGVNENDKMEIFLLQDGFFIRKAK